MPRFTVVIADDRYASYEEERAVLAEVDAAVTLFPSRSAAEARAVFAGADAILVNLFPMTAEVIGGLERCRVISRYGVGYDNVDVEAATARRIWVARVPDYCFEDVADHTLALLLGCIRGIVYRDRMVRRGEWNLRGHPSWRTTGRTLGIIGYGNAGRCFHRKVLGFGFGQVLVHDPNVRASVVRAAGGEPTDLEGLLSLADYVTVHVPLSPATRHMIGEREICSMRPGAILVNTARGPVLDETAVAAALRDGRLAAAGLDVFETEPLPADSPLRGLDNVILTDHAGWYTEESVRELKTKAAQNVAAVLAGRAPMYPVNSI